MKRIFIFAILILLFCSSVWATQEHGEPEGLYSHQLSHIFFMFAMIVLIIQIRRTSPLLEGWKYIEIAAFLFFLWNINVFVVHSLREYIPADFFSGSASEWTQKIDISTLKGRGFYAGKILDHVLSFGGMVAFIMGLRTFKKEMEGGDE